ncbi:TPA: PTS sugar transporter subunit IIB [Listeria monocytogenes]
MNILLACNAGMSTSMLAEMMRAVSEKSKKDYNIWCIDIEKVKSEIEKCDILLLAPQVIHTRKRLQKKFGNNVPIIMIPPKLYGTLDGEAVLKVTENEFDKFKLNQITNEKLD